MAQNRPIWSRSARSIVHGLMVLFLYPVNQTLGQKIVTIDAPGADMTADSGNGTISVGINNLGMITGYYLDGNEVAHGFLRSSGGKYTTFQAPGADTTSGSYNGTTPSSINDLGLVTGGYYDANSFEHGFLRTPAGEFTTFDVPGAGGYGTNPIAIDLDGSVVGWYTDSNYSFHAFLRHPNGKFSTWIGPDACTGNGSIGCFGSGATAVNAFGLVAGGFEDSKGNFVHHSFVRNAKGELTVFDVPGAGMGAYQGTGCPGCALGMNQFGAVAGIYSDSNSVNHGFVRSPDGKFTSFDAPGAGTDSFEGTGCFSDCRVSINDWGVITGVYIDGNFTYHGFVRSPKGQVAAIDPQGSIGTQPSGISDFGVITGYYVDSNNVFHGFIREPW